MKITNYTCEKCGWKGTEETVGVVVKSNTTLESLWGLKLCPNCIQLVTPTTRLYQIQFPYFMQFMYKEMDRHYPKKGDSYHDMTVKQMEELLKKVVDDYWEMDYDHFRKSYQTIDIANVCAMLYQRLCDI